MITKVDDAQSDAFGVMVFDAGIPGTNVTWNN
jgi:hypothetical protein